MLIRCLLVVVLLAAFPLTSAAAGLETIAWLEGHWEAEAFGGTIEEVWLPAAGNAMHGVFRLTVADSLVFSEFLQVTDLDDQIVMRFKPYQPDYSTWEGAGEPMELKATSPTSDQVVFEAINETSPSRIAYRIVGDELRVAVTGIDEELRFRRQR